VQNQHHITGGYHGGDISVPENPEEPIFMYYICGFAKTLRTGQITFL
jgi:hypothetical protein